MHRFFVEFYFVLFLLQMVGKPLEIRAHHEVKFNHLTSEDGLITNNVRAIYQDYQGFIWMATENGLHRYDGYEFKVYRYDEHNERSIGGNFALSIFQDSFHNLWIGNLDNGLSLYNRAEDNFLNFRHRADDSTSIIGNTIYSFLETEDRNLWLTTELGGLSYIDLGSFDPQNPVFHNISLPEHILNTGSVWIVSIIEAGKDKFWVGVHGAGLLRFDTRTLQFEEFLTDPKKGGVLPDKRVTNLYRDSKDRIWISTWGEGINLFYPEENKLITYKKGVGNHTIPNNQVATTIEDKHRDFWIGTDDGLCRMLDFQDQYPKGQFEVHINDPFNPYSILTNSVKELYLDDDDRLWVASYFGGVNIFDQDFFRFDILKHHPLVEKSLPGNNVTSVKEDKNGNIWIGTDNHGLCVFRYGISNIYQNEFEKVELINSENGQPENKIKCLEIDSAGNIWIGTWGGGMFAYDPRLRTMRHFGYRASGGLPSESVSSIESDRNGNVWIGTFSGGLGRYNPVSEKFTYYQHSIDDPSTIGGNKINIIFLDSRDRLWVGTESGGLNLYNRQTDSFKRINIEGLASVVDVLSIYECNKGYLWIGTHSKGLISFDPNAHEAFVFDRDNGLTSNLILGICEDKEKNLWLGTNEGITKFSREDSSFIYFYREEGLQSGQFSANSMLVSENGIMLFGGVNGLNIFYPNEIKKSDYIPDIVFTGLWIDNEPVNIQGLNSPLKKNIIITEELNLKHFQNSFSVAYAALGYDFSNRCTYKTYLEGFDEGWQFRDRERKVTFTNLDPGNYRLHVKVINRDGFEAQKYQTLSIRIVPAWYQTNVLWVALIASISFGLFLIVRIRINFFKRQNKVLEKKVNERTKELDEKAREVLEQNEELSVKNEQINQQREALEGTKAQLIKMNEKLESIVKERTEKLEKTVSELDRFVYSASHDLSAPLKSILGLLNIAKIDDDKIRIAEYLFYIENSIHKLEGVIQSLISYSRNSRLEVKNESFNLHELIDEIIRELAFLPDIDRISFQVNVPDSYPIFTDKQRFKIVLHNLINNSIKYADLEKRESKISIDTHVNNTDFVISVRDNGIGIERDRINRIFTMFYRGTERSSGSGLGLFIVKETLATIGGEIYVTSVPGEETNFFISLPKIHDN